MLERLKQRTIVLASASPRRSELVALAGIPYVIRPADIDEDLADGGDVRTKIEALSRAKAAHVAQMLADDPELSGAPVLGADTSVVVDGRIFGKPVDEADAHRMLRELSGRAHEVITGVTIIDGDETVTFSEVTEVVFDELSDADIDDYIACGEPADKAGAYGIQGKGGLFVSGIRGDYSNVVGLPIHRVCRELARLDAKAGGELDDAL